MDNFNKKIKCAVMDTKNEIRVYLNSVFSQTDTCNIFINNEKLNEKEFNIVVLKDRKKFLITNILREIMPTDLLEIKINSEYHRVIFRDFLNEFYYDKDDLGVKYKEDFISIKLWAPTAIKVEICLYDSYEKQVENVYKIYNMDFNYKNGIHKINLDKTHNGMYYLFKLYFKCRNNENIEEEIKYAVDPYAKAVCVNGDKGALIDINSKESRPEFWEKDKRPFIENLEDTILYEMHIRDFTINENSGVDNKLRGKFLGAVEEESIYIDKDNKKSCKTGIGHLKELGITHVQLMPCFDFESVDEEDLINKDNRNWGYDPKNYNVPEGSYATNPYNPYVRIIEFREMVRKFHKNNIRVVMDVVYNHMANTKNLDSIVPYYYFRTDDFGNLTNGSGCGNELATERIMVRKFIVDSVMHWINNYHIDGFRFDLMELIDLDTIKEIVSKSKSVDDKIIIYGEPWRADFSPIKNPTYKGSQKGKGFSVFNDTFRDAIRGNNSPSWGYINGGDCHNRDKAWTVIEGLKGSIYTLSKEPKESINYISCHDNYTLWDQIEKSTNSNIQDFKYQKNIDEKNILENYNVRQLLLGISIVLTAQGIPFLHSGVEFLRSKQGDCNSYKSTDNINEIKWENKIKYYEVFKYIKGIINIRKNHKIFRKRTSEDIIKNQNTFFVNDDEKSGVIISHIKNNDIDNDSWNNVLIVYNATSIDNYDINYKIPKSISGKWNIVVNDKIAGENILNIVEDNKLPSLRSHSFMIAYE